MNENRVFARPVDSRASRLARIALPVAYLAVCGAMTAACSAKPKYIEVDRHEEPRAGVVITATVEHESPKPAAKTAAAKPASAVRHWVGVAASPGRAERMVAWTRTEIALSDDGGKSFRDVLGGSGQVSAVAIDAKGNVFAVRKGSELGARTADGITTWRAIPGAVKTTSLSANGGAITWLGARKVKGVESPALAISRNNGDTWTFQDGAELGGFANQVMVDKTGAVRVVAANEADCGGGYQTRMVGNVQGGAWTAEAWPMDAPGNFGIGAAGWAYGIGACGDAFDTLCAAAPDGRAIAIATKRVPRELHVVSDGEVAWATLDGELAYLKDATVQFPAVGTPRHFTLTGVDADGQPLGVADGKALRWTPAGRWQPLFAAPARIA